MSDNREQVKEAIICALETLDDRIPFIGPFMDIPCVDKVERDVISRIVDYLCDCEFRDIDMLHVVSG